MFILLIDRKEIEEFFKTNNIEAIREFFARGWDPNYTLEKVGQFADKLHRLVNEPIAEEAAEKQGSVTTP
ncbi:hypothetical protein [Paenibacillus mucilaginosus]|uniref:hypothetical protein n=1 Tax=Paenibacillus mucilaginosus TaxID=61624 RepID=UPI003D218D25